VLGAFSDTGGAGETDAEAACAVPTSDVDVRPTAAAPELTSRMFLNNIRLLVSRIAPDSSPVMYP
jgi:hypothetical protein